MIVEQTQDRTIELKAFVNGVEVPFSLPPKCSLTFTIPEGVLPIPTGGESVRVTIKRLQQELDSL